LLSNFGFNCNQRHYSKGWDESNKVVVVRVAVDGFNAPVSGRAWQKMLKISFNLF